jgi:hypothetical protein
MLSRRTEKLAAGGFAFRRLDRCNVCSWMDRPSEFGAVERIYAAFA